MNHWTNNLEKRGPSRNGDCLENLQKERAKKVVQGQCLVLPFAKNVKRTGHVVRSAIRNKKSRHCPKTANRLSINNKKAERLVQKWVLDHLEHF